MLGAGGCEQAAKTSQAQAQTAQADHPEPVTSESPKSSEKTPLLLEDEPVSEASSGPFADNSRCFVCHVNYMQEKMAVTHAKANVGCANCHGASDAHIADESWASGGTGTPPDRMYARDEINSSCVVCHSRDEIDKAQDHAVLADTDGKKVCTDCHGNHRLTARRCKWK